MPYAANLMANRSGLVLSGLATALHTYCSDDPLIATISPSANPTPNVQGKKKSAWNIGRVVPLEF